MTDTVKLLVDGVEVDAPKTYTLLQACELAGVEIPHDQTLAGHSDADVALHALTDAMHAIGSTATWAAAIYA